MAHRDPSTVSIKAGDTVKILCPCEGEDHEGNYHRVPAGANGTVEMISVSGNEQGLGFTVCIPVDPEHNIVNVFDELDGPIENFLQLNA